MGHPDSEGIKHFRLFPPDFLPVLLEAAKLNDTNRERLNVSCDGSPFGKLWWAVEDLNL
jgi:nitrate reductase assembly molybdenum cofactor insertion protein NarJ